MNASIGKKFEDDEVRIQPYPYPAELIVSEENVSPVAFEREKSTLTASVKPSAELEPWEKGFSRRIEDSLALSFEQFERIANDPDVTIKELMLMINLIRAKAAALSKRISSEEVLVTESGLQKSLELSKEEFKRFDIVAAQVLGKLSEAIAPALKGNIQFAAATGALGLSGLGTGLQNYSQAAQTGYQSRSQILQGRSTAERQAEPAKSNEQSQAIQAAQEFLRSEHDTIARILGG